MQKSKCWYQLEDNSIRNNFGPSVQRAFHMGGGGGGQGATLGAWSHHAYGNRCIFLADNAIITCFSSKDA